MDAKAAPPLAGLRERSMVPLLRAYLELNHLKQLFRRGWLQRGLPPERCESVAEHTLGVALLAWLVADAYFPELDRDRLLRMALLHDVGEVHAGDLTPADGVPQEEKHRREARSVERVLAGLPGGAGYLALWREYEAGRTGEARLLRQIDRLEMALQAVVYERQGALDAGEFLQSAERALGAEPLRALLAELDGLRASGAG